MTVTNIAGDSAIHAAQTYDFDTPVDRLHTYSLKWEDNETVEASGELPMWVADMDLKTAPAVCKALSRRVDHGVFGYSIIPPEWNQSYVNWWGTRHGLHIDPDSLVFTTGVVPAISSMVRKLTTPAENVLIQTPVYNIFFNSILNNGRHVLEAPLAYDIDNDGAGHYSIDWADLEAKLADPQTTLMILCNPHNPTGMIWDRETLARIGSLCATHHVTVISDEIHCDLTDPGHEYVPFASVNKQCAMLSVTCLAPTKTFNIAGLQTAAVMVPDPVLRHKVWRGLNTDEVAEPNAFAMDATIAAFTHGGDWVDALRRYLANNKRETHRLIAEYNAGAPAEARVTLLDGPATYLLWLDCSAFTQATRTSHSGTAPHFSTTDGLCDYLRRNHGVRFSPGAQFGGNGCDFIRINVACPRTRVREGIGRLIAGLSELGKPSESGE